MATRKAASKRSQPGTAGYGALAGKIVERWREVGEEVALDRVVSEFGDVPRYDVVAALKQLEKAGAGEFVAGHGGRKSRFVWRARAAPEASRPSPPTAREPSRAGKGQAPVVKAAAAPSAGAAPSPGAGTLDHAFHLRPGFVATLRLPQDVTATEIERLCRFLEAIPFARPGRPQGS